MTTQTTEGKEVDMSPDTGLNALPADGALPRFEFDASEFMEFVKDENLTEEQAEALLAECWKIVVAFMRLPLGAREAAADKSGEAQKSAPLESPNVIPLREQFSTATKPKIVARAKQRARGKRDS